MNVQLAAAMLGVLAGFQSSAAPSPTPVTVARGVFDFDCDGKDDELLLLCVSGRREPQPWCQASGRLAGQFALEVRLSSGRSVRTNLNSLLLTDDRGELCFGAEDLPFTIEFADYNSDGQPDFFIFQPVGFLAFEYRFFTVAPPGEVTELPIGPDFHTIFLLGAALEPDFKLTGNGFTYTYFDMQRYVSVRGSCTWLPALGRFDCHENVVEGHDETEDQSDDGSP